MPFIDLDTGIRMHYRDDGDACPILFIPGLAATLDSWNYQVSDLYDRFRCICVDMRGHGDSDKPYSNYDYNEMCSDVRALLLALDLRDVTLVGWSMGAGVGLNYVTEFNADNRVSRLAMVAPATPRLLATDTEPFGMSAEDAQATAEGMRRALPETMAAFAGVNFYRTDCRQPSIGSSHFGSKCRPMSATSASKHWLKKTSEKNWTQLPCQRSFATGGMTRSRRLVGRSI